MSVDITVLNARRAQVAKAEYLDSTHIANRRRLDVY